MARFVTAHSRPLRPDIEPQLRSVADLIHEEFDHQLDPGAIDECLRQVAARFDGAPVRTFVPLLVRRDVRQELRAGLGQI